MNNKPIKNHELLLYATDHEYKSNGKAVSNFLLKIVKKAIVAATPKKSQKIQRTVRFSGTGEDVEMPVQAMVTAHAFRAFCLSMGNYHWTGGQQELDALMQKLDYDYEVERSELNAEASRGEKG